MGIEPGATGFRSKYASYCAMLPPAHPSPTPRTKGLPGKCPSCSCWASRPEIWTWRVPRTWASTWRERQRPACARWTGRTIGTRAVGTRLWNGKEEKCQMCFKMWAEMKTLALVSCSQNNQTRKYRPFYKLLYLQECYEHIFCIYRRIVGKFYWIIEPLISNVKSEKNK